MAKITQKSRLSVAFDDVAGAKVFEWEGVHVRYLLLDVPFWSYVAIQGRNTMSTTSG